MFCIIVWLSYLQYVSEPYKGTPALVGLRRFTGPDRTDSSERAERGEALLAHSISVGKPIAPKTVKGYIIYILYIYILFIVEMYIYLYLCIYFSWVGPAVALPFAILDPSPPGCGTPGQQPRGKVGLRTWSPIRFEAAGIA